MPSAVMHHLHLMISFAFDSGPTAGVSTRLLMLQKVLWGQPRGWAEQTRRSELGLLFCLSDSWGKMPFVKRWENLGLCAYGQPLSAEGASLFGHSVGFIIFIHPANIY